MAHGTVLSTESFPRVALISFTACYGNRLYPIARRSIWCGQNSPGMPYLTPNFQVPAVPRVDCPFHENLASLFLRYDCCGRLVQKSNVSRLINNSASAQGPAPQCQTLLKEFLQMNAYLHAGNAADPASLFLYIMGVLPINGPYAFELCTFTHFPP